MPILPCLVAFCQAFPPLYDDVAALLVQVGQVCASDVATKARDIDPSITRKYDSFCKKKKINNPGVCFITIFEREINLNQSQTESDDFKL